MVAEHGVGNGGVRRAAVGPEAASGEDPCGAPGPPLGTSRSKEPKGLALDSPQRPHCGGERVPVAQGPIAFSPGFLVDQGIDPVAPSDMGG